MAKLLCACLFVCVQIVFCQFGFLQRDNRGFSQNLLSPSRIRNQLQGLLHLQPQNTGTDPAFVYPFNNRPTDEYGRPVYEYRPNYDHGRPNYDSRPGISNNNMMPNQNQFEVPNRNDFYQQSAPPNGFQNPSSQNGFQDPDLNGFEYAPSQVGFPSAPPQTEIPNNGNGYQNPPSQNDFQDPNQDGFQYKPSQVGFPGAPPQTELPSNGNGFQNPPSQNGFQDQPSQSGFQNTPSQVGFSTSQNEFPNTNEDNAEGDTAPNRDASIDAKEKQNENTLIVIPGNTNIYKDGFVFGGPSNAVAFPDSQDEPKVPGFIIATEAPKVTQEAPKSTEPTTVLPASPELPPLTPVSTDSRNNFNFGPSGIFRNDLFFIRI